MPWYRVTLVQEQPVDVWVSEGSRKADKDKAFELALEDSEWGDYYEVIAFDDDEDRYEDEDEE